MPAGLSWPEHCEAAAPGVQAYYKVLPASSRTSPYVLIIPAISNEVSYCLHIPVGKMQRRRRHVVKPYQKIEEQLRLRPPGWWQWAVEQIPELASLTQTPQPPVFHPEGDAAVHTQLAVEACLTIDDPDLVWAALLHDIGKAGTTRSNAGRIISHGHDIVGAEMAERILQRLRMPVDRRTRIVWAIRHHAFHLSWQLKTPGQASKRQKKMVADERFALLLELLRVDSEASPGKPRGMKAYALYKELRRRVAGGE